MKISFQLVGKCDNSNPSSIPLKVIKQWEAEGLVKYLGECEDIRPIIAQSSCILLPSYREGVPRVLLEAMSMQKPIITTNVSGCKECIKSPQKHGEIFLGENGIMAKAKDSHSLFYAIKTFLSLSQSQKETMGRAAREYAIERFDISKTIQTYKQKVKLYAKKGKNLVFVSNTSFGMSNFRLEVLQALRDEGYTIHIIAPKDYSTQTLLENGLIFHPLKINSKGINPIEDFSTFSCIYKLLKHINPSLVFNYTIKPVIYSSLACNLLSLPNIAITTGLGYVFIGGGLKKRVLRRFVCMLYKIALHKTQEIWFLNNDDREVFLSYNIIKKEKSTLLDSEGVNTAHFYPQVFKENEDIVFTLIARMLWDKGVGELIECIKDLNQK
ncbi:glycosyltransferase [Helicobacter cholecystus]|uniref:glycosyltransferase n=1 Tax=Helicobacter cholecystus TaxID=45498 RepID=UPI002738486B|nr:glycosyltransferase [Helicobacter cholecystus]